MVGQAGPPGQRIEADSGDLVLVAGVSSGAEVMAEGHIHAYGALRGGRWPVSGDASARIFCRELGSRAGLDAGRYRVSENPRVATFWAGGQIRWMVTRSNFRRCERRVQSAVDQPGLRVQRSTPVGRIIAVTSGKAGGKTTTSAAFAMGPPNADSRQW